MDEKIMNDSLIGCCKISWRDRDEARVADWSPNWLPLKWTKKLWTTPWLAAAKSPIGRERLAHLERQGRGSSRWLVGSVSISNDEPSCRVFICCLIRSHHHIQWLRQQTISILGNAGPVINFACISFMAPFRGPIARMIELGRPFGLTTWDWTGFHSILVSLVFSLFFLQKRRTSESKRRRFEKFLGLEAPRWSH